MNYPIWQLSASGLLIAVVAVLHVFVSHFAVGGGLFLVLTERKARRENDDALLQYVRRHSRFFVLLTIVFGAVSGVGIWFTIGLVHPAATSALINAFVWGWAIEWTFFLTEIGAVLVYWYGWDRLTAREHEIVGWIYFGAAWASLVIINGILTFMLTPGDWLVTHAFWDGFFNPTYWPALVARTLGAMGLAGIYALFTSSWLADGALQRKINAYAIQYWVVPMAVGAPIAMLWLLAATASSGVPVAEIFATPSAAARDVLAHLWTPKTSGHPIAQRALIVTVVAPLVTLVVALVMLALRNKALLRIAAAAAMVGGLLSIGGAEWMREDLRKPYVIGSVMFVNGVRVPPPSGSPASLHSTSDEYEIGNIATNGVLAVDKWQEPLAAAYASSAPTISEERTKGRRVFRLLCSQCHTVDGYMAVRPLLYGQSSASIERVLDNLAVPHDAAGQPAAWSSERVTLATWRNRRMPPFAGTAAEKHALAVYLTSLGGGEILAPGAPQSGSGAAVFDTYCASCHGAGSGIQLDARLAGKSESEIYGMLSRLPQLNPAMPPFDGTETERHALATHLFELGSAKGRR